MKHFIIYIPGLGDKKVYAHIQKIALSLWRTSGVVPYYFPSGWATTSETFEEKKQRLLRTIDDAIAKGYTVSLVAASAGSSLAISALPERYQDVHRVVSICGKINYPETIEAALLAANPAFKDSMLSAHKAIARLSLADCKKILVIQAAHDSYVPARDGEVAGSHVYTMQSIGHASSIFMAITLFRHISLQFIKKP